jgi:hypothetical protein
LTGCPLEMYATGLTESGVVVVPTTRNV